MLDKSEYFCPSPFTYLVIIGSNVYNCQWLTKPIGTIDDDIMELWNSEAAKELRQSILDGSYRFCGQDCPRLARLPSTTWIQKKTELTNPYYQEIIAENKVHLAGGPRQMHLATNRACNLQCPSCRLQAIQHDDRHICLREKAILYRIMDQLEVLSICGSGDPFVAYLDVIEAVAGKDIEIKLSTNGLLLKKCWPKIKNKVSEIQISVDAATPETYAKNRSGRWHLLLENLEFASQLLSQGAIDFLCLVMVVQQNNWREMKQFVEMCQRYGARAQFDRLKNWGTYSPAEYKELDVLHPRHPEHSEMLELVKDPIFQMDVNMGVVSCAE